MNRHIIMTVVALAFSAACEGEPPKTPAGTPAGHNDGKPAEPLPPPDVPADNGAEAANPSGAGAATAAPKNGALPPCPCQCACGAGAAPMAAAGDGGAPDMAANDGGAAPVAAPQVATVGIVSGNITTMPKPSAANAVVYLEDAPIEPTAKMSIQIVNRQMNFAPYVAVVPVGGRVAFTNGDPFPHNVFSTDTDRFDMGMIPPNESRVRAFKKPGSYGLLCNVHPGMLGYLVVTPSSYWARADGKGHYSLKNVPNGTYKMTAWAPRQQPTTQSVTVKGGEVSLDFELHR